MKVQKKNYPKVSFIIPTLNAAHFLPSCLNAIRTQDYPQKKIEIIIADGGSTDSTIKIAKKYRATIISNPEILHEPGKARASEIATGELLFFTDADNILAHRKWLKLMVKPYVENVQITGLLPQTEPPPDSNSFNQYLGYLFTDPFTWFVYGDAANPKDYSHIYKSVKETKDYEVYQFNTDNHPLFGLSQGVGTSKKFKREKIGWSDDILSGIKLISEGGLIAYVPKAGIYHYHVRGFFDFLIKYRWRIRNNLLQKIKGMGFTSRESFMNPKRKMRKILFIPYSLSLILPIIDSIKLARKYKDIVMLWHSLACLGLGLEILYEVFKYKLGIKPKIAAIYGK